MCHSATFDLWRRHSSSAAGCDGGEVGTAPRGRRGIDADDHLTLAIALGPHGIADRLACFLPSLGYHGIFGIENQGIGWQGFSAFEGSGIGARHEEYTTAGTNGGWHISLTLALSRRGSARKVGFAIIYWIF
jgi:hypothetical protein